MIMWTVDSLNDFNFGRYQNMHVIVIWINIHKLKFSIYIKLYKNMTRLLLRF